MDCVSCRREPVQYIYQLCGHLCVCDMCLQTFKEVGLDQTCLVCHIQSKPIKIFFPENPEQEQQEMSKAVMEFRRTLGQRRRELERVEKALTKLEAVMPRLSLKRQELDDALVENNSFISKIYESDKPDFEKFTRLLRNSQGFYYKMTTEPELYKKEILCVALSYNRYYKMYEGTYTSKGSLLKIGGKPLVKNVGNAEYVFHYWVKIKI